MLTALLVTAGLFFASFADVANGQGVDASAYCFQCLQRRNHKDMYADDTDCHYFYMCQYVNATYATGVRRRCPIGSFWHDRILACMPESTGESCTDLCQNVAIQIQGCYPQPGNCATYYTCSNSASYAFCCPPLTSFNPATCQCDASETCTDTCTIVAPPPTTEAPPQNFGTYCIDSFNNKLQQTPDPAIFQIITADDTYTVNCAIDTTFSLDTCRCEGEANPQTLPPNRQCSLYLPFNSDTSDYSIDKYFTELVQSGNIDNNNFALGGGSLFVNGGHLEVPGLKNPGLTNQISICFFYRCQTPGCATGGIFSTNKDVAQSDFSFIVASQPGNILQVQGKALQGSSTYQYNVDTSTNPQSGFTQFCLTINGTVGNVYINNVLVSSSSEAGILLGNNQCPLSVGSDQTFGDFFGNIDEVLFCRFGLTADDVNAHFNGGLAAACLVPS